MLYICFGALQFINFRSLVLPPVFRSCSQFVIVIEGEDEIPQDTIISCCCGFVFADVAAVIRWSHASFIVWALDGAMLLYTAVVSEAFSFT